MAGVPGAAGVEPRPEGAVGETGTYGACGAVFGVDGLNVGGGGGGTGLTGCCARASPMAKAAIIAVSETAANSAAAMPKPCPRHADLLQVRSVVRTPFPRERT